MKRPKKASIRSVVRTLYDFLEFPEWHEKKVGPIERPRRITAGRHYLL